MAKKENERIFLFEHFDRKNDTQRRLQSVITIANETVLPICRALKMQPNLQDLLKWVADDEAFLQTYKASCKKDLTDNSEVILSIVVEAAEKAFREQTELHPYPTFGTRTLTSTEVEMLTYDGEALSYDESKLAEYCKVYLTDSNLIENYHKLEKLCKVLNSTFKGTELQPKEWNLMEWRHTITVTQEGFKVNPRQDFRRLNKLYK